MHLEAMIVRTWRYTWRLRSSEFGDTLGEPERVSLQMQLDALIERDWTSTRRPSMDGAPGAATPFIR